MARIKGTTAEQTRQDIVTAALDLFSERTFAGTALRDIAEHLHLTKSAVYYHFESKDALLAAILAPLTDSLGDLARRTVDARARLVPDDRAGSDALKVTTIRALVEIQLANLPLMQSLMFDPSALRALRAHQLSLPLDAEFERAFTGSDDAATVLRHRCAIGAVNGGIRLTARAMLNARGATRSGPRTTTAARPPRPTPRLSAAPLDPMYREILVASALAVLGLTGADGGAAPADVQTSDV